MTCGMLVSLKRLGEERAVAASLVAACLAGLAGGPGIAQPLQLQRARLMLGSAGQTVSLPVARFRIDDGRAFVLDRRTPRALLRFDDNPEVWVLAESPGPRGDEIYFNDTGEPILRLTRMGGVTVFTPRRPQGAAATTSGGAAALRLTSIGAAGLSQKLARCGAHVSYVVGRSIRFVAFAADPVSDGLIVDTAGVAEKAIELVARRSGGQLLLAHLRTVDILRGAHPGVRLNGAVLTISVVPSLLYVGRPSSAAIMRAIEAR